MVFSASFFPADHLVLTGASVPSGARSEPPKGEQPRQSHPEAPSLLAPMSSRVLREVGAKLHLKLHPCSIGGQEWLVAAPLPVH